MNHEQAIAEWVRLRNHYESMRSRRNKLLCEICESLGEPFQDGTPCWKNYETVYDTGKRVYLPRNEWCESCRMRQGLTYLMRVIAQRRGAALRRLIAMGKITINEPSSNS